MTLACASVRECPPEESARGRTVRYVQRVDSPETSCPICSDGEPLDVVADSQRPGSRHRLMPRSPATCALSPSGMSSSRSSFPTQELVAFWHEAMLAARTVDELYRPTKMNYEIHGNTIPHLHLHLYPRFADDPYVGGPIDPRLASFSRSPEQLSAIRRPFKRITADANMSRG